MKKALKIFFTALAVVIVALIIILLLSTLSDELNKQAREDTTDVDIQQDFDFDMDDIQIDMGDLEQEQDFSDIEVDDIDELVIQTLEEGDGEAAKAGDNLSVHYTGRLLNTDEVFDSSYNRDMPFEFTLGTGQVIQGWEEGIEGMKVGEKRILQIPSVMGYGATGSGASIPPNAGLEFEVELLEIL